MNFITAITCLKTPIKSGWFYGLINTSNCALANWFNTKVQIIKCDAIILVIVFDVSKKQVTV